MWIDKMQSVEEKACGKETEEREEDMRGEGKERGK